VREVKIGGIQKS